MNRKVSNSRVASAAVGVPQAKKEKRVVMSSTPVGQSSVSKVSENSISIRSTNAPRPSVESARKIASRKLPAAATKSPQRRPSTGIQNRTPTPSRSPKVEPVAIARKESSEKVGKSKVQVRRKVTAAAPKAVEFPQSSSRTTRRPSLTRRASESNGSKQNVSQDVVEPRRIPKRASEVKRRVCIGKAKEPSSRLSPRASKDSQPTSPSSVPPIRASAAKRPSTSKVRKERVSEEDNRMSAENTDGGDSEPCPYMDTTLKPERRHVATTRDSQELNKNRIGEAQPSDSTKSEDEKLMSKLVDELFAGDRWGAQYLRGAEDPLMQSIDRFAKTVVIPSSSAQRQLLGLRRSSGSDESRRGAEGPLPHCVLGNSSGLLCTGRSSQASMNTGRRSHSADAVSSVCREGLNRSGASISSWRDEQAKRRGADLAKCEKARAEGERNTAAARLHPNTRSQNKMRGKQDGAEQGGRSATPPQGTTSAIKHSRSPPKHVTFSSGSQHRGDLRVSSHPRNEALDKSKHQPAEGKPKGVLHFVNESYDLTSGNHDASGTFLARSTTAGGTTREYTAAGPDGDGNDHDDDDDVDNDDDDEEDDGDENDFAANNSMQLRRLLNRNVFDQNMLCNKESAVFAKKWEAMDEGERSAAKKDRSQWRPWMTASESSGTTSESLMRTSPSGTIGATQESPEGCSDMRDSGLYMPGFGSERADVEDYDHVDSYRSKMSNVSTDTDDTGNSYTTEQLVRLLEENEVLPLEERFMNPDQVRKAEDLLFQKRLQQMEDQRETECTLNLGSRRVVGNASTHDARFTHVPASLPNCSRRNKASNCSEECREMERLCEAPDLSESQNHSRTSSVDVEDHTPDLMDTVTSIHGDELLSSCNGSKDRVAELERCTNASAVPLPKPPELQSNADSSSHAADIPALKTHTKLPIKVEPEGACKSTVPSSLSSLDVKERVSTRRPLSTLVKHSRSAKKAAVDTLHASESHFNVPRSVSNSHGNSQSRCADGSPLSKPALLQTPRSSVTKTRQESQEGIGSQPRAVGGTSAPHPPTSPGPPAGSRGVLQQLESGKVHKDHGEVSTPSRINKARSKFTTKPST